MALRIEIGKSYKEGLYRIRIGDVDGVSELMNITKKEVLEEIEKEMR